MQLIHSRPSIIPASPLSVSSVGSEAMQQRCWTKPARQSRQLSVSSVGSEAMQLACRTALWLLFVQLSVSSVGSEAMQLRLRSGEVVRYQVFQYPRSDRRRCNNYPTLLSQVTEYESFSILGRIGGDAT